jgi:TolA-binding protein
VLRPIETATPPASAARVPTPVVQRRTVPVARPRLALAPEPAPVVEQPLVETAPAPTAVAPAPGSAAPAPAVLPPPLPAPPPPSLTPATLYRMAEAAMARKDGGESRRRLEELVARFPSDPLADSARYELAERASSAGDRRGAVRLLSAIQGREPSLVEAASFLRCRLAAEQGDDREARGCFERFRTAYPGSGRDPEALAALVQLAWRQDDCAVARLLANEYRRRHPAGPFAAGAARIEGACAGR